MLAFGEGRNRQVGDLKNPACLMARNPFKINELAGYQRISPFPAFASFRLARYGIVKNHPFFFPQCFHRVFAISPHWPHPGHILLHPGF